MTVGFKERRKGMGLRACKPCDARCCRYFALPIEKPQTAGDFDDVRWYLMHRRVSVFVEDGDWYVQVDNRCKNLLPDNRCAIYEDRPRICRGYKTESCEYYGGDYAHELLLKSVEELDGYARKYLRERRLRARKRRLRRRAKLATGTNRNR